MIKTTWRYWYTAADISDTYAYIQFTPENGFNPAWKIENHTSLQRSEKVQEMWIRHISANIIVMATAPRVPIAATYLCLFVMPESMPTYAPELDLPMPILQGTMGATNQLFANFPRSMYMNKGLIAYCPTSGLTAGQHQLVIHCLWEKSQPAGSF